MKISVETKYNVGQALFLRKDAEKSQLKPSYIITIKFIGIGRSGFPERIDYVMSGQNYPISEDVLSEKWIDETTARKIIARYYEKKADRTLKNRI